MSRGRPRKFDPSVPPHIDPRCLPKGAYWDRSSRSWYTILPHPKPHRHPIGNATASLADLHRAIEEVGGVQRDTIAWLLARYHDGTDFRALAPSTRNSYEKNRKAVETRKTRFGLLGTLRLAAITRPAVQNLIEGIAAEGHPSKANHLLRYLRLVFRWGLNHGDAPAAWKLANPADGIKAARERKAFKMPTPAALEAVIAYARAGATSRAHTKGSVAPYLWCVMEIAYRCRLRGIEVVTLTEANHTEAGIVTNRRKGSRDNVVAWSPSLREAWDTLVALRDVAMKRHRVPVPIRAAQRVLVVSQTGTPLTKGGLDTAWQRLINGALRDKVITEDQRFSLHGLKHRGITDTKGNKADKQTAAGHTTPQMTDRYDHELPVVESARSPCNQDFHANP